MPPQELKRLADRIKEIPVKDIRNAKTLKERTQDLGLQAAMVRDGLSAVTSFWAMANEEKTTFSSEVKDFAGVDLSEEEVSTLDGFARSMESKLQEVILDFQSTNAPCVPLDEYNGMSIRVISITEFEEEFRLDLALNEYKPKIEREHPRVLVTLRLGEEGKPVAFIADPSALEHMIKFLQFAQKQLEEAERKKNS